MTRAAKRFGCLALAVLASTGILVVADDRAEVERAVLDYVEAVEQGRPELIERSVHPALAKTGFGRRNPGDPYDVVPMNYASLLEVAVKFKKEGWVPENPQHEVEIFDVLDQTAAAKLTAFWGIDYIHLAKYSGKWKIIQVLWQSPPDG